MYINKINIFLKKKTSKSIRKVIVLSFIAIIIQIIMPMNIKAFATPDYSLYMNAINGYAEMQVVSSGTKYHDQEIILNSGQSLWVCSNLAGYYAGLENVALHNPANDMIDGDGYHEYWVIDTKCKLILNGVFAHFILLEATADEYMEPVHQHVFELGTLVQGTCISDGVIGHVCTVCDYVLDTEVIPAVEYMMKEKHDQIMQAQSGQTIILDMYTWTALPKEFMKWIAERRDVTFILRFICNGGNKEIVIPQNEIIDLEYEWYGIEFISKMGQMMYE